MKNNLKINDILFAVFNGKMLTENDSLVNEALPLEIRKETMKESVSDWANWNPSEFAGLGVTVADIQAEIDAMTANEFNGVIRCVLTDGVPLAELMKLKK